MFSCVLTGPINNICLNAGEVVRLFTCSAVLIYNLNLARVDLMTKPFQVALNISKDHFIREEFEVLTNITEPIKLEVEGVVDGRMKRETAADYRESYKRKLDARCRAQLDHVLKRCKEALKEVYDECHRVLPILVRSMLCWPLKIDNICSTEQLFGKRQNVCSSERVVYSRFGEDYMNLKRSERSFVEDLMQVQITFEIFDKEHHEGYLWVILVICLLFGMLTFSLSRQAQETSRVVVLQFEQEKEKIDLTVFVLEKMFAFVFIRVIVRAMVYHQNYLKKIDFQNHYIGKHFLRIDSRRKQAGKVGVLPLRYLESPHYVDLHLVECSRTELKSILSYSISLIFMIIAVTFFLLVDNVFYKTLNIVAKNAQVEFEQQGYHDVNITVIGSGLIAKMLRLSLEGFETQARLNTTSSIDQCLPNPSKLSSWIIVKIYLLFLAIVILTCYEAIINRLRRFICARFYPKREKQRVLYLYNQLLRRRKGYFKLLLDRMLQTLRRRKYSARLDFLNRLVFYYPTCFLWIKLLHRKSCSICEVKKPKRFHDCISYKCFLTYCDECWHDLGETCPICAEDSNLAHENCAPDH